MFEVISIWESTFCLYALPQPLREFFEGAAVMIFVTEGWPQANVHLHKRLLILILLSLPVKHWCGGVKDRSF